MRVLTAAVAVVVAAEMRAVVMVGKPRGSGSARGDVRTMTMVMADMVTEDTGDRDDRSVMTVVLRMVVVEAIAMVMAMMAERMVLRITGAVTMDLSREDHTNWLSSAE